MTGFGMYSVSVAQCVEYFRGIQITIGFGDLLDKLLRHVQLFFSSRDKIDPRHYQVQFQDCHDELLAPSLGCVSGLLCGLFFIFNAQLAPTCNGARGSRSS
jgi:hypothetical protein